MMGLVWNKEVRRQGGRNNIVEVNDIMLAGLTRWSRSIGRRQISALSVHIRPSLQLSLRLFDNNLHFYSCSSLL